MELGVGERSMFSELLLNHFDVRNQPNIDQFQGYKRPNFLGLGFHIRDLFVLLSELLDRQRINLPSPAPSHTRAAAKIFRTLLKINSPIKQSLFTLGSLSQLVVPVSPFMTRPVVSLKSM